MPRPRDAVGDSPIEARSIAALEIADEMHEVADHFDEITEDLEAEEEVWFEADELAAVSTVTLGRADLDRVDLAGDLASAETLARAPQLDAIASAISSAGISLASLPGWPDAGPAGQGLGELADELIGELRPGELLVLAGARRGVGRTSLLAQLGDGLALVDAPRRPATPVLFVGSDPPALWRARTLARYFGVDARTFIDPSRARREPRTSAMLSEFATSSWADIDARQRFAARDALGAAERRAATIHSLRRWQLELGVRHQVEVWPVVIVDAVDDHELASLAALASSEALIVLASCDLGEDDLVRARAIDGVASVRIHAAPVDEQTLALELCHRRLGPRGTGHLRWHRPSGRFEPRLSTLGRA